MKHSEADPIRATAVTTIRGTLAVWEAEPGSENSIHEVRVCTKKLRAYLRAYPDKAPINAANRQLKLLADNYGGLRDAQVKYATLRRLIWDWSPKKRKKFNGVIDHIAHAKKNQEIELTPLDPRVAFEEILRVWPNLDAKPGTWFSSFDRLYLKSRYLGEVALKSNEDETYHRWRKWVKYWLYCLTGLSKGKVPSDYEKRLQRLGESLGQFHDVCVLEQALTAPDVQHQFGQELKPFYKMIKAEKKAMKKSYKKAFKSLFKVPRKKRELMLGGYS